MITNDRHGWGTFKLGNFTGRLSYIEDVPVDLLQLFIDWHDKGSGCAWIDEEGTEFTLVLTPYSVYVIVERGGVELIDLSELKIEEIEKELIDDIESDFEGWVKFMPSDDIDDVMNHREVIQNQLWLLKELRNNGS